MVNSDRFLKYVRLRRAPPGETRKEDPSKLFSGGKYWFAAALLKDAYPKGTPPREALDELERLKKHLSNVALFTSLPLSVTAKLLQLLEDGKKDAWSATNAALVVKGYLKDQQSADLDFQLAMTKAWNNNTIHSFARKKIAELSRMNLTNDEKEVLKNMLTLSLEKDRYGVLLALETLTTYLCSPEAKKHNLEMVNVTMGLLESW